MKGKRTAFGFLETDDLRNRVTKELGGLLPTLDERILWTDYIPGSALRTNTPLVAIGYADKVRYVDVSHLSPFKMVNEVMNALDDYCPQVQFLSPRQVAVLQEDLDQLALDRTQVVSDALHMMQNPAVTIDDCCRIAKEASRIGIFPKYFPDPDASASGNVILNFLRSRQATFMDAQMLTEMLTEVIKSRKYLTTRGMGALEAEREESACEDQEEMEIS